MAGSKTSSAAHHSVRQRHIRSYLAGRGLSTILAPKISWGRLSQKQSSPCLKMFRRPSCHAIPPKDENNPPRREKISIFLKNVRSCEYRYHYSKMDQKKILILTITSWNKIQEIQKKTVWTQNLSSAIILRNWFQIFAFTLLHKIRNQLRSDHSLRKFVCCLWYTIVIVLEF